MNYRRSVSTIVTLALLSGAGAWAQDTQTVETDSDWYQRVKLGPLHLGLDAASVVAALGEPTEKSDPVEEGATGLFVTEWSWPAQGAWITLSSETKEGPQAIERLQLTSPCPLKTPEGIGIGSTAEQVLFAYKAQLDPETPPTEQAIVAGSLFGGIIFTLEKRVVTEIFLGAAAE